MPQARGYGGRVVQRLRVSLNYKLLSAEASGALGDLGTFVPIVAALTLVNGLDLGTTLLFTGLYNMLTGLLFGVPMPVQPMKSIAAVAISLASPLSVPQIMAAGISTACFMLFLGITGLMSLVHNLIPLPVVRGIQLSQGLSFGKSAITYILHTQDFATGKSTGHRPWLGFDGLLLALIAFCFIVLVTGSGNRFVENDGAQPREVAQEDEEIRNKKERGDVIPTALVVFAVGLVLAFARNPLIFKTLSLGPSAPNLVKISWKDWKTGFVRGAIPQIPLSVLNSVIAVCKLSSDLFPEKPVSPRAVSTSVGLMNLVGCWFGAMPVCHGAGGLAGQVRFGARSGASVVFLGLGKIFLSLLLGGSLVKILTEFPVGLLGVLLLFSGVELAMSCRDQTSRSDAFVMLVCTVVSLGSSNAALGFGCGLGLFLLLKVREIDWREVRSAEWGWRRQDNLSAMGYQECRSVP